MNCLPAFGSFAVLTALLPLGAALPPNLVLILSDDGGWADWGCYGSKDFKTPRLDALAAQGVRFTQAYVAASICGPSRAALMTGRHPLRYGYEYNNVPSAMHPNSRYTGADMGLPREEVTLAEALRPLGYRSGIVGKWHLGLADRFHPLRRGFDRFYGFRGGARSFWAIKQPNAEQQLWLDDAPAPEPPAGEYLTDVFTTRAIEFVRASKDRPFFLYLSYNAVHSPLHTREDDAAPYAHLADKRRRILGGMTAALDRGVGRVLDALDELGIADRTVVLFLNDNGGERDVIGADNGPLAGSKGTNYEGGIRVPMIVRWPGLGRTDVDFDLPVSALDVFPTFLKVAGGDPASLKQPLDGVDLRTWLGDPPPLGRPHPTLFWRKGPHAAIRFDDWKLHRQPDRPAELYDLSTDIGEQHDLSAQQPGVVRDLFARLWEWEKLQPRPAWMEDPKYDVETVRRIAAYRQPEVRPANSAAVAATAPTGPALPPPRNLRSEFRGDVPVLDTDSPRLDWRFDLREGKHGWTPVARQIQVASSLDRLGKGTPDLWDSGMTPGAAPWVEYAGRPVPPGGDAWWRVRVQAADGALTAWSEPTRWIRGPSAVQWSGAVWIGALSTAQAGLPPHTRRDVAAQMSPDQVELYRRVPDLARRSIQVRRSFTLPAKPLRAVAFVSGLGHYELSVNGQRADESLLQPAWSDYDKTVYYNAVDLTRRLQTGENVIGVGLGNGFFNVTGDRYVKLFGSFGPPRMILRLDVTCVDDSRHLVVSDGSWHWRESPVTFNCIFGGEDYDARVRQTGWDSRGFAAEGWKPVCIVEPPDGALRAQPTPGLTVSGSYPVVERKETAPGVTRLDFGQNLAGFPDLTIDGPAGATLTFHASEALTPEGRTSQKHVQNNSRPPLPDTLLRYTADGKGPVTWRPRFHYYGYRWAEITGDARLVDARSNFLHLDVPLVGEFACSNETINRVHGLILAAMRSNLQHVLTDCPHREKLGWLEVFHLLGPSLLYNFDVASLIRKVTRDMIDGQEGSGLVPNIAPEYAVFNPIFRDSPEWGASVVLLPWLLDQWYGDARSLEAAYPTMVRFVEYLRSQQQNGLVKHGLGDWGDHGPGRPGVSQLTSPGVTGTAIYHECLRVLAAVARQLGRPEAEALRFEKLGAEARRVFNDTFFNAAAGHYDRGSQTAQAMPLALGLATDVSAGPALRALQKNLAAGGHLPTAGDIGLRYVVEALADGGDSESVFRLVTQDQGPGYAYQLKAGMTTLHEAWDVNPGKSANHCMLGHIEQWFYSHLAGLRPDRGMTGWQRFTVAPEPVGDVTWAKARYQSPAGEIAVAWRIAAGAFILDVTVPPGAEAEVVLPPGRSPRVTTLAGGLASGELVRPLAPETEHRHRYRATSGAYRFALSQTK